VLLKVDIGVATAWLKPRPTFTCAHCGGAMQVIRTRPPPKPLRRNRPPAGAAGCTVM